MFTALRRPDAEKDRIVIVSQDGTADIATIVDYDDQRIFAASPNQDYSIPIADVQAKSYVGGHGRIYLIGVDPEYKQDTIRLANLEKSIVLRQVTQFERKADEQKKLNIKDLLLYALIGILLLAVVFK